MAGTAVKSNRVDGGIRNQSFELWAAGVPVNYAVTTSNGTVVQLTKEMSDLHRAGIPQVEVTRLPLQPFEPLVHDGFSAFRIYATGAWAARSNNVRVSGTVADLTGVAAFGLPWSFEVEGRFSFWARGTKGKQFELLVAMRNAAATQRIYLNTEPGIWSTTQTGIVFELEPSWHKYNVNVRFSFIVDDGGTTGENAGLASTDSLVFGFYNVSTASAVDPFVLDLDGLYWELLDGRSHEEA